MKVLFDETKKILGVYEDDAVGIEGAFSIYLPSALKTKLSKTVNVSDSVKYTRNIRLIDSPTEWTVDDVLLAKYDEMAQKGQSFWFTQFENAECINKQNSQISSGLFGISVAPDGAVEFNPIQLAYGTSAMELYLEADASPIVKVSALGGEFVEATPTFSGRLVVSLPVTTNKVIVRIENSNGVDVPVHALAIFY